MLRFIAAPSLIVVMSAATLAQPPQPAAFEVATIKPAAPTTGGGRSTTSGNTVSYNNTTLMNVLMRAFGLMYSNQIVGPSWILENRYDLVAKMPDNTPKENVSSMLQTLLIDRFKLRLHHETRDLPAYALIKGNGKLKLVEDEGEQKNSGSVNDGNRQMKSTDMATLSRLAGLTLHVPVLNQTSLSGYYDFPYELSREETGRDSDPSIFTIFADLGLKLESRKSPLDVIVIDAGEKVPTDN